MKGRGKQGARGTRGAGIEDRQTDDQIVAFAFAETTQALPMAQAEDTHTQTNKTKTHFALSS